MRNLRKKIVSSVLAGALVTAMAFTTVPVSAQSVSTSEFGTFTYTLSRSGQSVTAKTSCTVAASKLITTVEVQLNSTGESLGTVTTQKSDAKVATAIKVTNYASAKLAAFSCHEARGNSSVAKYLSSTF